MQLGTFSISLTVKDIRASRAFYEKLGFTRYDGDGKTWLIMQNGTTVIGLFQGMFEKNIMTFNPQDVRGVQQHLKAQGISLIHEVADMDAQTPDYITLEDPDGNPIMFDQHPADYKPA